MLQAYFDESFNDDLLVISGFVATQVGWEAFTTEWREALVQLNGGKPFKMSTVNQEKPRDERDAKVDHFSHIINNHTMFGVTVSVNRNLLKSILSNHVERELCEPYYFCYWTIISHLLGDRRYLLNGQKIELIFDDRCEKHLINRNLESFFSAAPQASLDQLAGSPQFASDDVAIPLQAADLRAWWARRRIDEREKGYSRRQGPSGLRSPRTGVNIECDANYLYTYRKLAILNRML